MPEAIQAVQKGNYNIMLLTETKIHDSVYFPKLLGYDVYCSMVTATATEVRREKGRAGITSRERPEGWLIGLTRFHGTNMASYDLIMGNLWTPVMGAYLLPSKLDHLLDL